MQGEILKGHLDSLILASLEAGGAHGYAIIEGLRRRSRGAFNLPEGTVYPSLHRLERDGLLASRWSVYAGRRRRVYRVTRKGARELTERRRQWSGFAAAVEAVLEPAR